MKELRYKIYSLCLGAFVAELSSFSTSVRRKGRCHVILQPTSTLLLRFALYTCCNSGTTYFYAYDKAASAYV